MSAQDWPDKWPPLNDIIAILRSKPRGCRRGDFAELDARRGRGIVAVMGFGWIHIRKRLLDDGIVRLTPDGALAFVSATGSGRSADARYSADEDDEVTESRALTATAEEIEAVCNVLKINPAPILKMLFDTEPTFAPMPEEEPSPANDDLPDGI